MSIHRWHSHILIYMPKLILGICKYSDSGYYKIVQSYSYIWCNKQNSLDKDEKDICLLEFYLKQKF